MVRSEKTICSQIPLALTFCFLMLLFFCIEVLYELKVNIVCVSWCRCEDSPPQPPRKQQPPAANGTGKTSNNVMTLRVHLNDIYVLKTEKLFFCFLRNYPCSHRSTRSSKTAVLFMPGQ